MGQKAIFVLIRIILKPHRPLSLVNKKRAVVGF